MRGERPVRHIFLQRNTSGYRVLLFSLITLALLAIQHQTRWMDPFRASASSVFAPVYLIANQPAWAAEILGNYFVSQRKLQAELARLRDENLLLQAEKLQVEALKRENEVLRDLRSSAEVVSDRYLIADTIGMERSTGRHQLVLNKGRRHGVFPGQAVLDAQGLMGQIIEAGPDSSRVMLLTDGQHAVPVRIQRNDLPTIAGGRANGLLELQSLPSTADVQMGDLLVSSGLGGRFPAGYPVATVVEVRPDRKDGFARVMAEPTAQLGKADR